jgi:glucose-6-phosphate 1-dehydrogenase
MPDKQTSPCLVLIFGASGDLTRRKLVPSLYDLYRQHQLSEHLAVLGTSRSAMSDDAFRERLKDSARKFAGAFDNASWTEFAKRIYYHAADSTLAGHYEGLKARIAEVQGRHQTGENLLMYLAMAPQLYEPTIEQIGAQGMVTEGKAWCSINRDSRPWQRIVVEKPFGHDPASAAQLNRVLGRVFEEESIYRIDHYLGKETVQNLMVVRFANTIFEPIWSRQYIDHVQITAAETVGVEGRGGYYDSPSGGAMRDMIQSHLLQVMAVVAMEPPVSMNGEEVRAEKAKVLRAARAPSPVEIPRLAVRGQYGAGVIPGAISKAVSGAASGAAIPGEAVTGYRQEEGVKNDSQTDTFAALVVHVDSWRWGGVPFYLRSGKRLARKLTQVVIRFKPTPHPLLFDGGGGHAHATPNQMVINVQPDEGIRLMLEGKVPGPAMNIRSLEMDFDYQAQFHATPPEAYGTLLLDVIKGDQALFKDRHEIEHAWRIVQPVLDYWRDYPQDDLPNYAAGSWGPSAADVMVARDGRQWYNPADLAT